MSINSEINQMFDDICGTPINKSSKIKEEIEKSKTDIVTFFKLAYGIGLEKHHQDFLESLEREVYYRSRIYTHIHICKCGAEYELAVVGDRIGNDDWMKPTAVSFKYECFYCFRCAAMIKVIGKIIKVRSTDSKFEFGRG